MNITDESWELKIESSRKEEKVRRGEFCLWGQALRIDQNSTARRTRPSNRTRLPGVCAFNCLRQLLTTVGESGDGLVCIRSVTGTASGTHCRQYWQWWIPTVRAETSPKASSSGKGETRTRTRTRVAQPVRRTAQQRERVWRVGEWPIGRVSAETRESFGGAYPNACYRHVIPASLLRGKRARGCVSL